MNVKEDYSPKRIFFVAGLRYECTSSRKVSSVKLTSCSESMEPGKSDLSAAKSHSFRSSPARNAAQASAAIWEALPRINWAGFYLRQGDELVLGPFQGKPACTKIPFGKGVCGTAAEQDRIQLVPDVELFPGHIACDSASRSEIVIPIHQNGRVVGVLDMDSPEKDRFSPEDREGLSALVRVLEETTDFPD